MRIIRSAQYRVMPWKNGGGSTTEIAIHPEDAGLSGKPFDWRVSIADVTADGPFSKFPGYDRHIMVIAGAGMMLETDAAGTLDLSAALKPMSFSGEWSVNGRLYGGPVRDFNLMLRREICSGRLFVQRASERVSLNAHSKTILCHFLEGEASAGGHVLAATDSLLLDNEAAALLPLAPLTLAVCEISYHGQGLRI
jgi:environmental stress-induced protein Ves